MDLSYFLEMVDLHHRYGSNLRKYHAEWKSRPTNENFFFWLDFGEARNLDLENCSRKRLDDMRVRYLNREERMLYEVVVGDGGKLIWRKDGERVDTTDAWRDSVEGIVRVGDPAPLWADRPAFLRGSSEESGVGSEEEDATTNTGVKMNDSVVKNHIAEQSNQPNTTEAPKRNSSLQNILRHPMAAIKPEKAKKTKKQQWIFVSLIFYFPQSVPGPYLKHEKGSRHEKQRLHRHQTIRCIPAFILLTRLQNLSRRNNPHQRRPITK